jgi:hypothetical protein
MVVDRQRWRRQLLAGSGHQGLPRRRTDANVRSRPKAVIERVLLQILPSLA